jgi:hypothetical protein
MKTQITPFMKFTALFLAAFVIGSLYGAVWERCTAEQMLVTTPATADELAKAKAGLSRRVALEPSKDVENPNATKTSKS